MFLFIKGLILVSLVLLKKSHPRYSLLCIVRTLFLNICWSSRTLRILRLPGSTFNPRFTVKWDAWKARYLWVWFCYWGYFRISWLFSTLSQRCQSSSSYVRNTIDFLDKLCNRELFFQTSGTAIYRVAPFHANIFTRVFVDTALASLPHKADLWLQYILISLLSGLQGRIRCSSLWILLTLNTPI